MLYSSTLKLAAEVENSVGMGQKINTPRAHLRKEPIPLPVPGEEVLLARGHIGSCQRNWQVYGCSDTKKSWFG
jgi:hypothetical protein